jgi:hypothetical protein
MKSMTPHGITGLERVTQVVSITKGVSSLAETFTDVPNESTMRISHSVDRAS